jgi:hypothetical protein
MYKSANWQYFAHPYQRTTFTVNTGKERGVPLTFYYKLRILYLH